MTTDDKSVSDRLYVFAKVLASNEWTTALLGAYNPTGSTEVPYETAKTALVADLTALSRRSQPEPDGWRLVPVEPTEAMLEAAERFEDEKEPNDWGNMVQISYAETWAAMLSAAPQSTEGK